MITNKMKHAYLIIAHNELKILQLLISALDDERNDIYVHIDKKASFDGRELKTIHADLFILPIRLDARWGDFSLVEVEMSLFREAYAKRPYGYFHLLSGVDFPIKSQDYIHDFCDAHQGMEFVGIAQNVSQKELDWRSQHWFLFARDFQSNNLIKRTLRGIFARLQTVVGYKRTKLQVKKGAQWCSITAELVKHLLQNEKQIRKMFNHTYCPDELFIQTWCWNSFFRNRLYDISDEFEGCKRYIKWEKGVLSPLDKEDIEVMFQSSKWFARKFSTENMYLIEEVLKRIK